MSCGVFKFGAFELDTARVELRKHGIAVRLQEQPFRILVLLLNARGAVVSRDELRRVLWPENTFVEFDHGLNAAVNKLRDSLGDVAATPRFIQTVPRRGYRFIAPVEMVPNAPAAPAPASTEDPAPAVAAQPQRRYSRSPALVGLAVVVISAAVIARRSQPAAHEPGPQPLTTYPGRELTPSFSPDGNRVAFVWDGPDGRNFDIYVKDIGSESPVRLVSNRAADLQPVWSPDGRSIAFLRMSSGSAAEIRIVSLQGGDERVVGVLRVSLRDAQFRRLMTWFPDSSALVIADRITEDAPRALFRLSLATGSRWQLTFPPPAYAGDDGPDLSPDGSALVFARERNPLSGDLFLLRLTPDFAAEHEPTQLTDSKDVNSEPMWLGDGGRLVFLKGAQHRRQFYRMSIDGSDAPAPIFAVSEICRGGVALSRSKNRIAYPRTNWDVNIWQLDLTAGGARPELFIQSTYLEHLPAFSPDGSRVAFISNRSGKLELWACDRNGRNPALVAKTDGEAGYFEWSPDGRRIALSAQRDGFSHIFITSAAGGKPNAVTLGHYNNSSPSWSPDGRFLYLTSNRDGRFALFKNELQGDHVVEAQRLPIAADRVIASADGRYLVYVVGGDEVSKLVLRSLETGEEKVIAASISNDGSFCLSRTGIYFIGAMDAHGKSPIQFMNFAASRPVIIGYAEKPVAWGMSVSPDGRRLLYTQFDRIEQDLMLIDMQSAW